MNDTVASLIERINCALTQAKTMGGNKVVALKPPYSIPEAITRQPLQRFNSQPVQMLV